MKKFLYRLALSIGAASTMVATSPLGAGATGNHQHYKRHHKPSFTYQKNWNYTKQNNSNRGDGLIIQANYNETNQNNSSSSWSGWTFQKNSNYTEQNNYNSGDGVIIQANYNETNQNNSNGSD
jgi:hypothetical protein